MKILVYKTSLKTKKKVRHIRPLFDGHPLVTDWSVDTEDCDNVLRVEALTDLKYSDVTYLLNAFGYYCELLTD
ncbi:MAG: hypothetical protein Roseis2KO_36810 [Roseivirga sp.]